MNRFAQGLLLLLFSALGSAAWSASETYIGVSYLQGYYRETAANFNNSLVGVRVGENVSENVGAEFFAATSANQANFYVGSTYVQAKVNNAYGGHIRLRTTPSNGLFGYVRLGVAHGTVSASTRYGSGWTSGTSASYGAGLEFDLSPKMFVQLDYSSYYSNPGPADYDSIALTD